MPTERTPYEKRGRMTELLDRRQCKDQRSAPAHEEAAALTKHGLTTEEQEVLKIPGQFYRALAALPQFHPADLEEAAFRVHALGRIVAMRAAHRAHPDLVPNKSGTTL